MIIEWIISFSKFSESLDLSFLSFYAKFVFVYLAIKKSIVSRSEFKIDSLIFLFTPSYHRNYNFLDCDCFKTLLSSTNSLAKLLSESLLLESLLSANSMGQSHSKLKFKSSNHIQNCSLNQPISISDRH